MSAAEPPYDPDECARLWRAGDRAGAAAAHYRALAAAAAPGARAAREAFMADFELHRHNAAHLPPALGATGPAVVVVGSVIPAVGPWDPSWTEKALTGSEEAVVYAAADLARRGFRVTVAMDPPPASLWRLPTMNPRYVGINEYLAEKGEEAAAAIFWRHTRFDLAKGRARKTFFWPHDLMGAFSTAGLDGVFYLSEYHRRALVAACPALAAVPGVVSGNGILPEQFAAAFLPAPPGAARGPLRPKARPHACIYASNYARGLKLLLDVWPAVRRAVPDATLDVFYGRTTWGAMSDADLKAVCAKLEALRADGVTERGAVSHQALADAFAEASVLAYPNTTLSETFCITAVKAQFAGLLPVCGLAGALAEVVAPGAPAVPNGADAPAFERALVAALRGAAAADREPYVAFAAPFTWEACVDKWLGLMGLAPDPRH